MLLQSADVAPLAEQLELVAVDCDSLEVVLVVAAGNMAEAGRPAVPASKAAGALQSSQVGWD